MRSFGKRAAVIVLCGASAYLIAVLFTRAVIHSLLAPTNSAVVLPKSDHSWRECSFSAGKDRVQGWWFKGEQSKPAVLLVHGIRENRLSMFSRGEFFAEQGWSVLNIDLPGHGMSSSRMVTLGLTESAVIAEAYRWMHERVPSGRIGVIGFSLGGASVVLGDSAAPFDAVVLEAVYSDIFQAIENRLSMKLGIFAHPAVRLMKSQFQSAAGINPDRLSPLHAIKKIHVPIMIAGGESDPRTKEWESVLLYENANAPKELWIVPSAGHENFFEKDTNAYVQHVFAFLERNLQ